MEHTLANAAKTARVAKSTVLRAIKSGRLSARREEDGTYRIDASELARVYDVHQFANQASRAKNHGEPVEDGDAPGNRAGVEVAILRVRVEVLEGQLERERQDRERERDREDRERETILQRERDTVADLRRRLDRAEERVLALSAPPIQPAPVASESAVEEPRKAAMGEAAPRASRSLLARLLGF